MSGTSVRKLAARLLDRALSSRSALSGPLAAAQGGLDIRDRRLLQELVQGSLRWRARLDHVISAAADRPMTRIDAELYAPLRLAAYQLLFLDRVPAYAAVSEAVEEARRRVPRSASFVNGVLRRISRSPRLEDWPVEIADPIERLAAETSHPRFLVERWRSAFGTERAAEILDANNRRRPLQLLGFSDRGGRDELARRLRAEGVETRPLALSPFALEVVDGDPLATCAYLEGDLYVQDQASQAAALVPAARKDEEVFDAAAAPGGKSFALLASEPALRIVAADVSIARVAITSDNCRRLRRPLRLLAAAAARPALARRFDRVVADLPCSGTGILGRHPDLKWRLSEAEIGRLSSEALELLAGVAELVRPGGLLIAITCSIEDEENEEVVKELLRDRSEFALLPLEELLEPRVAECVRGPGLWRLFPTRRNDGFTVQVLRKR